MNKKRTLLVVLAMVLVCALSVAGTLALLAENSGPVTNTFVAAVPGGEEFVDTFEIKEYKIEPDGKGNYTLNEEEETNANSYTVVPGVTLDKDAFVKLKRTNNTPAYLFIEVKNTLNKDVFTMAVDTSVWGKLDGVTGKNGGEVYVLGTAANPTVLNAVNNVTKYHIISGNKVTVADDNNLGITNTNNTIQFYAYISQATVTKDGKNTNNPAEVFDVCFVPKTPTQP